MKKGGVLWFQIGFDMTHADQIISANIGDQVATVQHDLTITPLKMIICERCCRKRENGVHLASSVSNSASAGIVICKECIDHIATVLNDAI